MQGTRYSLYTDTRQCPVATTNCTFIRHAQQADALFVDVVRHDRETRSNFDTTCFLRMLYRHHFDVSLTYVTIGLYLGYCNTTN